MPLGTGPKVQENQDHLCFLPYLSKVLQALQRIMLLKKVTSLGLP